MWGCDLHSFCCIVHIFFNIRVAQSHPSGLEKWKYYYIVIYILEFYHFGSASVLPGKLKLCERYWDMKWVGVALIKPVPQWRIQF